ncbi:hypothetical protein VARIO8X_120036 [Burkholderiales bacterium 8X]|nr:hypothetical protein VARIO8X_120036 [Burkholderiales bacterium 8X]
MQREPENGRRVLSTRRRQPHRRALIAHRL